MPLLVQPPQNWEELEQVVAALQTWVGKQEGVNSALQSATGSIVAIPTGGIVAWSTSTAPTGYLLCNGQAVDRTVYAALYEVIGVTYGAGDALRTFNVPDLRGRFPLGVAASGTGSTLAGTGGSIDHTHAGPSHTHTISGSTATEAAHTHTFTTGTENNQSNVTHTTEDDLVANNAHVHSGTTDAGSAHSHSAGSLAADAGGTGATGSGNPPFLAVNYIIRT